ncbi:general transcription factor II-I repeat domain-containing protein 2A-like [Sceloporus undulatus]|uniref:general transcription factor II-I repeat domain-containing protein 2A-like n=1 Tax=Sceloporus undulatus TaxID=8520 RepID=UPI001C4DCD3C|nr:general transcription factor II-I repeat domain-containing protein 2A-like [Sceloporus undulatus]XP_042306981.1 general transcription factor II-I repeat domain-containing protein 2A-like [Sceloporus undulatus]XP_042306983.1 general transcription factor II-I repeat domain-containing protein 2A-like [Sceloporus undulatus]
MMSKKVAAKRKIDVEWRVFNPQWTEDYFFIEHKEKAVCLICQGTVAVFKEYNLHQHYQMHHKDTYDGFVGQVRKDKISKLKTSLASQQNILVKQKQQNISSMRASYEIAQAIASAGKSFTEGEFVKDCLLIAAKAMCPEKADVFNTVSLSACTISQRVEELGDNLKQQLQNSAKNLSYFSLALDESNNIRDSAQLLIFIRGINDNFEVTEELAALQSIKETTTGEDIYETVCQTVNGLELDWAKLASVTTNGAPSMVGSKRGVVARINQEMEKHNRSQPIAIHCLFHQQALCSKSLKWDFVMKTVVSCVNFIRANALNHRQFQEFLSKENADWEDVLYHTEVRWLSRGKVLRCFYDLLPEIAAFLVSKNKEVPELNDAEWKWHLAFLTDVTEFLNGLNVELKRKGKLICDMYASVKSFELKLGLLIKQVNEGHFSHFPTTQNLSAEKPLVAFPTKTCVELLEKLQSEFQARFKELHLHEQGIQLFRNPFSIDIENVDSIYQMELCDLHSCDSLKDAFKSSSLLNFYASLPSEKYPNIRNHARKMATIFGSTYVCEQTFSRMKHLKAPARSRLTDEHLHHLLRIAVTNMEPDINHLISQKQAQSSH